MCGVLSERGSKAIQAIFSSAPFQRCIEREADWIAGVIEREIAVKLNKPVVANTVSVVCIDIWKWISWNVPEKIHESCARILNGWNVGKKNVTTLIFYSICNCVLLRNNCNKTGHGFTALYTAQLHFQLDCNQVMIKTKDTHTNRENNSLGRSRGCPFTPDCTI